jgi:hypothetical protein
MDKESLRKIIQKGPDEPLPDDIDNLTIKELRLKAAGQSDQLSANQEASIALVYAIVVVT